MCIFVCAVCYLSQLALWLSGEGWTSLLSQPSPPLTVLSVCFTVVIVEGGVAVAHVAVFRLFRRGL